MPTAVTGHGRHGGIGIGMAATVNVLLSGPGPLLTRSAYLEQVRRIAPPELKDRDGELAELAGFCLDETRGPYVWWQAGPWAGKSALMSTFVLHPPSKLRQRVQVVAFFITARLAGQDTRAAFTAAVAEQLTALTGQQPPAVADEGLREAWLLDLLRQTAEACHEQGVRLVLLVDGLDEDRSITDAVGGNSIAGLLPGDPPAGMRVIVAGRPNPPIPDDVPDQHPLRDPGIVRRLSPSASARNLQRLGKVELKRLLTGSPIERDLLGLLTTTRGGLSGPDLRQLTGATLLDIEEVLHTVSGRTFNRRAAEWDPQTGPEVYLLGHEELQQAATSYLDPTQLAAYRDRIHAWADTYRTPAPGQPAWPPGTPEYLLVGYSRLLADVRDLTRLVALAIDPVRHDWMLDTTGGDTAALDEIRTVQTLVLAECGTEFGLEAMAMLSVRRNNLIERNNNIPTDLPAVWSQLGQSTRAEALARSITGPSRRVRALTTLAKAVALVGDQDQSARLVADAEKAAQSINDLDMQEKALAEVASTSEHDGGQRLGAGTSQTVRTLGVLRQDAASSELVRRIAASGELNRAEQIARSMPFDYDRMAALVGLIHAAAAAGEPGRAEQLAIDAERMVWNLDRAERAQGLAALIQAAEAVGQHDRAKRLAIDAEWLCCAITYKSPERQQRLAALIRSVAAADHPDHADQLVADAKRLFGNERTIVEGTADERTYEGKQELLRSLPALARAVAAVGDYDRAERMASDIERMARTVVYPLHQKNRVLPALLQAVVAAGDYNWARLLAVDVERIWRSAGLDASRRALDALVQAAVSVGEYEQAERLVARANADPVWQAWMLIAAVKAANGDQDRAGRLAAIAENAISMIAASSERVLALANLSKSLAATTDRRWAERLVADAEQASRNLSVRDESQARALAALAEAVAVVGDDGRARLLAADAEQIVRTITDPSRRTFLLINLVKAATAVGDRTRADWLASEAEQIAHTLTDDEDLRSEALTGLADAVGQPVAGRLLGAAFAAGGWWVPLRAAASVAPGLVSRVAEVVFGNERSRYNKGT